MNHESLDEQGGRPLGSVPFLDAGFEDLVVSLPRKPDGTVDMREITDYVAAASRTARSLS